MPWVRKSFKGGKVYAKVDLAGALVVDKGLCEIKYREGDERTYRARASAIGELGEELGTPPPPGPDASDGPPSGADASTPRPPGASRTPALPAARSPTAPPPPARKGPRVLPRPRPDAIQVYTDGACAGNPGPAGLGAVLLYRGRRKEISEFLGEATNNIAELTAILRALQAVKDPSLPVDLCLDSKYSMGVLAQGFKARANRELIAEIQEEMQRFRDLAFVKVPGHAGIPENERADELARAAIRGRGRGR
jgi:ribonuclease HI